MARKPSIASGAKPVTRASARSTTDMDGPRGCTNLKLRQFMRQVAQHYEAEMAKAGLKTTRYSLLFYGDKLGPVRPVDLAARIRMDASTLTRNLRPLVDAGWVTVTADSDARSPRVGVTPEGHAKRDEAKRQWRVAQDGIDRLLGKARVAELLALVDMSMDLLAPAAESGRDVP